MRFEPLQHLGLRRNFCTTGKRPRRPIPSLTSTTPRPKRIQTVFYEHEYELEQDSHGLRRRTYLPTLPSRRSHREQIPRQPREQTPTPTRNAKGKLPIQRPRVQPTRQPNRNTFSRSRFNSPHRSSAHSYTTSYTPSNPPYHNATTDPTLLRRPRLGSYRPMHPYFPGKINGDIFGMNMQNRPMTIDQKLPDKPNQSKTDDRKGETGNQAPRLEKTNRTQGR